MILFCRHNVFKQIPNPAGCEHASKGRAGSWQTGRPADISWSIWCCALSRNHWHIARLQHGKEDWTRIQISSVWFLVHLCCRPYILFPALLGVHPEGVSSKCLDMVKTWCSKPLLIRPPVCMPSRTVIGLWNVRGVHSASVVDYASIEQQLGWVIIMIWLKNLNLFLYSLCFCYFRSACCFITCTYIHFPIKVMCLIDKRHPNRLFCTRAAVNDWL